MRLSHGWCGLFLFWLGVTALCGIAAWTLEILGPAGSNSAVAGQEQPAPEPPIIEFAGNVPATRLAADVGPVQLTVVAPATNSTEQVASLQDVPSPATQPAWPDTSDVSQHERALPARHEAAPPDRTLHLRIFRDSQRCPDTACYKWHLIQQHLRPPHPATLDMAKLRLAPSIRDAAEKGKVDLMIDAVEHHRTVNGHDSITLIATSLTGVTPHDGQ
jgi:hypothetical protein